MFLAYFFSITNMVLEYSSFYVVINITLYNKHIMSLMLYIMLQIHRMVFQNYNMYVVCQISFSASCVFY